MLSAAVFASCNKALEKDEVEAGFAPAPAVPKVTNLAVTSVNEVEKIAVLTATVEGITEGMENVEVGFMSSTDPSFQSSAAMLVDPANGTITAAVSVVPGATNHFVAMAATDGGASYTEVVSYDVPDIPMYAKLSTAYAGTFYSWQDGSAKAHEIYLQVSEDHTTVTMYHWDPFLAGYVKADATNANALVGTINEENYTIKFVADQAPFFTFGFADAALVTFDETGENPLSEFVVTVSKDCSTMVIPEYGVYSMEQNGFYAGWGGDEESAAGPITLYAK